MNQAGSSKADTIVKLALVFFISLFAFSVGTFVGKSVSDSEKRNAKLSAQEEQNRNMASIDPKSLDVEPESALTDHEVSSLEKEFLDDASRSHDEHSPSASHDSHDKKDDSHRTVASNNKHNADRGTHGSHKEKNDTHKSSSDGYKKISRSKQTEAGHDTHGEKKEHSSSHSKNVAHSDSNHKKPPYDSKVLKATQRVLEGKAPSKEYKRKPNAVAKKLPMIPKSIKGKYTVQVSAYATQSEANAHKKNLIDKGYESFVVSAKVKGKTWYRVNIGAFHSLKNAKNFKSTFLKEHTDQAAIVKKIVK